MNDKLTIRALEEALPFVEENNEETRRLLGIPTKAEFENSPDPRVAAVMATPFLKPDEFDQLTTGKQVILFCGFATGTIPDRLVPIFERRISEGTVCIVVSDNAGNDHGILKIAYAAGEGAYEAGALPLEKVNINAHSQIKAVITQALNEGLSGSRLLQRMRDLYSYKEDEQKPLAEWDKPEGVLPPVSPIREILVRSGFVDEDGNHLPDPNKK